MWSISLKTWVKSSKNKDWIYTNGGQNHSNNKGFTPIDSLEN